MNRTLSCLLFIMMMVCSMNANAEEITIYTEEFPPFNFTQNKAVTGASTEVVERVMAEAGLRAKIVVLPWAEAYKHAQQEKNAFIYSISRRESREKLFKWAGILTPATYAVMALRSRNDIVIERLEDLKKFKIGTSLDDARESYLISKGFTVDDFVRAEGSNATLKNFKNLLNNRIDVWPMPDAVAYFLVRQEGHSEPEALLQKVFPLEELSGGYYLAASLATSDDLVARVAQALKRFKQTDDYYKILGHWNVDAMGLRTSAPVAKLIYAMKYFTRVTKIGYLASDKLSAHKEGGLYRKEIREPLSEHYVQSFDAWKESFVKMQKEVDILILGSNTEIRGWDDETARNFTKTQTIIPTGCLTERMAEFAFIGYRENDLIVNMKIAKQMGLNVPSSLLSKASRLIE